jgi:hypothetical protein
MLRKLSSRAHSCLRRGCSVGEFGRKDCIAALQERMWQDAAKLLTIHGAEPTAIAATSYSRPHCDITLNSTNVVSAVTMGPDSPQTIY